MCKSILGGKWVKIPSFRQKKHDLAVRVITRLRDEIPSFAKQNHGYFFVN